MPKQKGMPKATYGISLYLNKKDFDMLKNLRESESSISNIDIFRVGLETLLADLKKGDKYDGN